MVSCISQSRYECAQCCKVTFLYMCAELVYFWFLISSEGQNDMLAQIPFLSPPTHHYRLLLNSHILHYKT